MNKKKPITFLWIFLWKSLKMLIFFSFIYTAGVMFRLRNVNIAIQILFTICFFLILNKIDSMNERLNLLEKK